MQIKSKGNEEKECMGKSIYVYDLTCSILYYHSAASAQINLKRVLGIHHETCCKYIDTMNPYLTHFLLLSCPIRLLYLVINQLKRY